MATASKFFNFIPKSDGGVRILLYGDVGHWADIDSRQVVSELLSLEGLYSSIDIHINSMGGDVFSGIAIFNALRQSKANITIYIDGLAASIAGIIALCGKPLYMSQYARLMLHKVSGGAYGSAKELRETADLIDDLEKSLADMISSRVNLTPEEVHSRYFADGADHWLTAHEALELGMIDGIHDLPEEPSLSGESSTDEIYSVFSNRLDQAQNNPKNKDMALLEEIKKIPSFENATESDVVARLREQTIKIEAQGQAINEMRAKMESLEQKELEAVLNTAVADGRITEGQKPTYMNLLKSDRANTESLLSSLPKNKSQSFPSARQYTQPQASSGGAGAFQGKTWDELDRAGLLAQFKESDPDGFANAYKAEFGVDYKFDTGSN